MEKNLAQALQKKKDSMAEWLFLSEIWQEFLFP